MIMIDLKLFSSLAKVRFSGVTGEVAPFSSLGMPLEKTRCKCLTSNVIKVNQSKSNLIEFRWTATTWPVWRFQKRSE
jgi:hypothetical protein